MPPPGSLALTHDQKMQFVRWVDLGCPINTGQGSDTNFGWFLDDVRPTLDVSLPRPGTNVLPVTMIRLGVADANSGVDMATLSVTSTVAVNGRAAGAQLADLATQAGDGVYTIALAQPLKNVANAVLVVRIADKQGNITTVLREFSTTIDLGKSTYLPLARR